MPASSSALRSATARWAASARWGLQSNEAATALATERMAAYIERVVATAPPLTPEQRDRLTALLGTDQG